MTLQLCALANGKGWAGVKKGVDSLVGAHESPFSARFSDTTHGNSPVVQDKVSDPDSRNCSNPHDSGHSQTLVNVPHSKTRILTRLSVCWSCSK
jgi:hypothetical protein